MLVRTDVPALHLVAMRALLGSLTLIVLLRLRGVLSIPDRHRGRLVVAGVLQAVHWAAFFIAIKETTVAVALATLYLGPLLAAAAAWRLLGEQWRRGAVIGLGIGLAGVLLVVRPGAGATVSGVVAALVAALTMAGLIVVAKPAAEDLGGLTVAAAELAVAAFVLLPWAGAAVPSIPESWWVFAVLGVVFTGVSGLIYWSAMRRLPVATVGVLMYLEPASAVVWAWLVLGEALDWITWVGVALVLVGGVTASRNGEADAAIAAPASL